jgi:hypothetical protein
MKSIPPSLLHENWEFESGLRTDLLDIVRYCSMQHTSNMYVCRYVCMYVCMYAYEIQVKQIFLGTTYQSGEKFIKWPDNIPKGHKINQSVLKYSKWPQNIPTFSMQRPSKINPNRDFLNENIPFWESRQSSYFRKKSEKYPVAIT